MRTVTSENDILRSTDRKSEKEGDKREEQHSYSRKRNGRKTEKEKTESEAAGLNPGHKDRQLAVQKGKTVRVNKRLGCRGAEQKSERSITNTPTQLDGVLVLFSCREAGSLVSIHLPTPAACSLLCFHSADPHTASAPCWRLFNSHYTCLISHFYNKKASIRRPSGALQCCEEGNEGLNEFRRMKFGIHISFSSLSPSRTCKIFLCSTFTAIQPPRLQQNAQRWRMMERHVGRRLHCGGAGSSSNPEESRCSD